MRSAILGSALLLLLAGGFAAAQPGGNDRQALAQAKREADQATARSTRLEQQARRATSEAQRARAEAEALAARLVAAEAGLTAAERRIAIIAGLQRAHQARLAERQQPLARLTAALQTMARRPAALALVQPGSVENTAHVRSLLAATLPEIRRRTAALRAEVQRSEALRTQAEQARLALATSRVQLQQRRSELAAFEASQRNRSRQLTGLALTESDRALAFSEEARLLARQIGTAEFQARLENSLSQLPPPLPRPGEGAEAGSTRIPYALPVDGRVLTGVGEISDGGVHARGLTLATAPGAPVSAPANGRVLHAAPFRRYGYVVIIDHGRGWLSVVTDLAAIRVRPGQQVRRGERLGFAGDDDPRVTVELRRDGRPIPFAQLISG
jgi:murein hydrolase activator